MKRIHPEDAPTCEKCGGQIEHETKLFSEVPENGLCECPEVPNWTGEKDLIESVYVGRLQSQLRVNLAIIELLKTVHRFELPSEIAENFDVELVSALVEIQGLENGDLMNTRERLLRAAGVHKSVWGRWIQ